MIKEAAIKYQGKIFTGKDHLEISLNLIKNGIFDSPYNKDSIEGFMTIDKQFVGRREAFDIAIRNGQINSNLEYKYSDLLFCEDLKTGQDF